MHYNAIKHTLKQQKSHKVVVYFFFTSLGRSLDKTISRLEMELAVARTSGNNGPPLVKPSSQSLQKAFIVIGINTAFSSKKRRESLRETWVPTGSTLLSALSLHINLNFSFTDPIHGVGPCRS